MTLRQYIFGLGLVSITLISTPIGAGSPVVVPEFKVNPEYTNWGHVASLETGWSDNTMSIMLDPSVPFVDNPHPFSVSGGCKITSAGYALDPKDPGINVHEATLLSAFVAHKKVRQLIFGCAYDKPRVIAVGLAD